jgi:hypothetical protein
MLTAQAVLAHLAPDPTERRLSSLLETQGVTATTLLGTLDMGAALTVVPVASGLLVLAVDRIDPEDGWERYDLPASMVVKAPPGWTDVVAAFRQLRSALLTQLGAAPLLAYGPTLSDRVS